ncbi:MAG TPA: polysaccharide biosynthesis/export family protein [Vicinamibacterales bacterium]|nr:polysaccharide biosynthesis/export family protein [Vicinamibacterales bacterium]
MTVVLRSAAVIAIACALLVPAAAAQTQPRPATNGPKVEAVTPPAGYVIGPEDLLTIVFWRDRDMSADVVVRPDGMISLPLLNDLQAAGYTPEQLAVALEKAASKYITEPSASVIVREIRSRKVYVVGEVARPGTVPLMSEMNVLQVIAAVGGLLEYADRDNITIVRNKNGREWRFKFNYNDVVKGKKLQQNILLQPGDTVVVR